MSERVEIGLEAALAPWTLAGLSKETPVLLALSGGADSRALLHLLSEQSKRDGFPLYAAHVHHGIRGAEADRDLEFSQGLADAYGCELFVSKADIPRLAKESGRSLEAEARGVRYEFFSRVMRERSIPILVTAHHADDNLETILFRLSRGTGLRGLCGIAPARTFACGVLVRPLLPFTRREILSYCRSLGLEFVQDATNAEPICARNRIRLEAVPVLENVTGEPQRSVWRMTRALAEDQDYLELATQEFLKKHRTERGVSVSAIQEAHPAIRARIWDALSPRPLERVHRNALESLIQNGRSGSRCALPDRFVACLQSGYLTVLPDLRRKGELPAVFGVQTLSLCDGKLKIFVTKNENFEEVENVHDLVTQSCIIIERVYLPTDALTWRFRSPGDRIRKGNRTRSLADEYQRARVAPVLRDALPVLCRGEEIVWAPFVGVSDEVRARNFEGELFQIEFYLPDLYEWEDDCYV